MDAFRVEKNAEFGRFAVAIRDLKPGELLFEEFPFVVGPKPSANCCCLECFCPLDATSSGSRCEKCAWPLCEDCKTLSAFFSHKRECEIFAASKSKFYNHKDPDTVCVQLDCITPLRILLMKDAEPVRWKAEIEPMEHHREQRFGSPTWHADAQNIVDYLLGPCKIRQRGLKVNSELIQQAIGILEVNAFEARTAKGHSIRCLYPKIAVLSHSCTPNTTHSIHPSNDYKFNLRATIPISKGSQVFACYTFTLNGTADRQQHLMRGKFFQCRCERCSDPTELGTNFSSLICRECQSGNLISSDPLNAEAIWQCNKCSFEDAAENVNRLLKALQDEINSTSSIDELENLLPKYEGALHSNHFIMTSIRNALVDSYGRLRGHLYGELSDSSLRRKIELCEEVLVILSAFESGKSRARGLMLFEMHAPMALLGKSTSSRTLLMRAREVLAESLEILSWEDENVCECLKPARLSATNLDALIDSLKDN